MEPKVKIITYALEVWFMQESSVERQWGFILKEQAFTLHQRNDETSHA